MIATVLAIQTVQVTSEARARPIKTAFTTTSAFRYMPHGLRSRGKVAVPITEALSCASAEQGTAAAATRAVTHTTAIRENRLSDAQNCIPTDLVTYSASDVTMLHWQV